MSGEISDLCSRVAALEAALARATHAARSAYGNAGQHLENLRKEVVCGYHGHAFALFKQYGPGPCNFVDFEFRCLKCGARYTVPAHERNARETALTQKAAP